MTNFFLNSRFPPKPSRLIIGFDADDTLWHNENIFVDIKERLRSMVQKYVSESDLDSRLVETERANLNIYGYGVKSFTLSVIETFISITDGKGEAKDISEILSWGKEMLDYPAHLLDNVEEILRQLSQDHTLALITKGELFHQSSKIASSHLDEHFEIIQVLSEKNEKIYRDLLSTLSIQPKNFLMVGNSLKSDVLPVVAIGSQAVHIPYHMTWELEQVPEAEKTKSGYMELKDISGLPNLVKQLELELNS